MPQFRQDQRGTTSSLQPKTKQTQNATARDENNSQMKSQVDNFSFANIFYFLFFNIFLTKISFSAFCMDFEQKNKERPENF